MPAAFIDDGYSVTETIPALANCYDEQIVTFRPVTSSEIAQYQTELRKAGDDEARERDAVCKLLASKIVSWDLKTSKGEDVPVNAQTLGQLVPTFFWAVFKLIFRAANGPEKDDALKNSPGGSGY